MNYHISELLCDQSFRFLTGRDKGSPKHSATAKPAKNSLQGQPCCVHRAALSAAESYTKEDCILLETSVYKNEFQAMKERFPNNTFVFLNTNTWKNIKTNKTFCLWSHQTATSQAAQTFVCADADVQPVTADHQ